MQMLSSRGVPGARHGTHGPPHQFQILVEIGIQELDLEVLFVLYELIDQCGFSYLPATYHRIGLDLRIFIELLKDR
jgi:hypothetical protein